MKYDTTPLNIETAGVDLTQPEQELRFVPDDNLDHRPIESGEISHPTLVGRSVGFDTFIESRPETTKLDNFKEKLSAPKYRTWALTALIASVSALGGGFAVYWIGSHQQSPAATASERKPATVKPETDITSSETFVSKGAADSAAAESSERHIQPATTVKGNQGGVAPDQQDQRDQQPDDGTSLASDVTETAVTAAQPAANLGNSTRPQEQEREAKVGAYVVEKPAGRTPLARCADGTYSYSASRSAACAGRGGVGEWIGAGKPVPAKPSKQAAYVLGPRGGCYYLDSSNKKIYVEKKYCEQ